MIIYIINKLVQIATFSTWKIYRNDVIKLFYQTLGRCMEHEKFREHVDPLATQVGQVSDPLRFLYKGFPEGGTFFFFLFRGYSGLGWRSFFIDQHLYPRGQESEIFQSASHSPGLLRYGKSLETLSSVLPVLNCTFLALIK